MEAVGSKEVIAGRGKPAETSDARVARRNVGGNLVEMPCAFAEYARQRIGEGRAHLQHRHRQQDDRGRLTRVGGDGGQQSGQLITPPPGRMHVLGVIGGADSLGAVRAEVTNPNEVVREAAISALCSWKTADAAPYLLALAKESPFSSRKTTTLRGYINLVRDESLSTGKKLEMCRQAAGLIQRNEEKRLLLGVLGTVPSVEAMSMAMTYMADPLVRNEACFAVVAICDKIVLQNPEAVADAIGKVLNATKNRNVIRRAKQVLNKAK